MIITSTLDKNDKITPEQIREIENAKKMTITFDEDSPQMDAEMEKAFRLAAKNRNRYINIS